MTEATEGVAGGPLGAPRRASSCSSPARPNLARDRQATTYKAKMISRVLAPRHAAFLFAALVLLALGACGGEPAKVPATALSPSSVRTSERPPDVQYGPAHCVTFVPGCAFEHWAGGSEARVNSLHGQGIDRLGARVRALGRAPDGLVEAIEIEGAGNFAYAVQWHPEWFCMQNRFDGALFGAFGEACRKRRDARRQSSLEGPDGPDGRVAWR